MRRLFSKVLAFVMTLAMLISAMPMIVLASDIRVAVNDQIVQFDQPLRNVNDRLIAPIRPIADLAGAETRWNAETQTVTVIFGNTGVAAAIGNANMTVRNMTTGETHAVELYVAPRIYYGASFFPVEQMAQALGLNVVWDGAARMVRISTQDWIPSEIIEAPGPLPTPTPAQLQNVLGRDIEAFRLTNARAFTEAAPGNIMGAEYEYGFFTTGNWRGGSVYFNIGGRYSSMAGVFGPLANAPAGRSATLTILGDGRVLANFEVLANDPANTFSVDVSGVTQIQFVYASGGDGRNFAIANITLAAAGSAVTQFNPPIGVYSSTATLGQDIMAYRTTNARELSRAAPGNIMGAEYESGFLTAGAWQGGSIYYNINGLYNTMAGVFGPLANAPDGRTATLTISGDGRTLATFEVLANDPARTFSVDVTGVTQVRFNYSSGGDGRNFGVANIVVSTGNAIAQFNAPIGLYGNPMTLGQDVMAYRLVNAREFSRGSPGRMMGAEYTSGFNTTGNWRGGAAYFNINGLYRYMAGVFGPMDNAPANRTVTLTIFGDGRTLATLEVHSSDPVRPFNVNVAGVTQLRIAYTATGDGRNFGVGYVVLR